MSVLTRERGALESGLHSVSHPPSHNLGPRGGGGGAGSLLWAPMQDGDTVCCGGALRDGERPQI